MFGSIFGNFSLENHLRELKKLRELNESSFNFKTTENFNFIKDKPLKEMLDTHSFKTEFGIVLSSNSKNCLYGKIFIPCLPKEMLSIHIDSSKKVIIINVLKESIESYLTETFRNEDDKSLRTMVKTEIEKYNNSYEIPFSRFDNIFKEKEGELDESTMKFKYLNGVIMFRCDFKKYNKTNDKLKKYEL